MPGKKDPKAINNEEVINTEANKEAGQDYFSFEEEEYEGDPFDPWY